MNASRFFIPVALVVLGVVVGVFGYQFWGGRQTLEGGPAQAAAIEELASSIESSVTASVGEKMETYLEELKAEARAGGADSVTTEELTAAIVAKLEDAMATGEIQLPPAGATGQSGDSEAASSATSSDADRTDVAAVEFPDKKKPIQFASEQQLQQIHFVFDSAELTPGAQRKARLAAQAIVEQQPTKVAIQGFSDTMGGVGHNEELSRQRAASVAELLVAAGVPAEILEIKGMGSSPLPEPTGDGVREPLNRCVSITAIR
jgi:outer membrane protein OmpA-like peptidoglycan-associated protein